MLGQLLGDNTVLESFFNTQGLTSPVLLCECSIGTVCLAGNPIPTGMCTAPNLIFNLWAPKGKFFSCQLYATVPSSGSSAYSHLYNP